MRFSLLLLLVILAATAATSIDVDNTKATEYSDDENLTPEEFDRLQISINCHSEKKLNQDLLRSTMIRNRAHLNKVKSWVEPEIYANSLYRYGLENALPRINTPIGEVPIIADFLGAAVQSMSDISDNGVRYLELGVSFGKTFYLVTQAIDNTADPSKSVAYGFDAEDINPRLVELLSPEEEPEVISTWELSRSMIRRGKPGTLTEVKRSGRTLVRYAAGDIVDPASYLQLQNNSFNLIYSDAFHEGQYLVMEIESILHARIMGMSSFAIVWDDLESMLRHWNAICQTLREMYPGSACRKLDIYGWLGEQEHKHTVGLFTTDDLFYLQCLFQEMETKKKEE